MDTLTVDTLSLLGGRPCLDFVNTVDWRLREHPVEVLRTPDDLGRWGRRLGLLTAEAPPASAAELARSRVLREALYALFAAHAGDAALPPAALETLAVEDRAALRASVLVPASRNGTRDDARAGAAVTWTIGPAAGAAAVRHAVARDATDLLASPLAQRVRVCPQDGCGWVFLDETKNGSRRWCSMRGCGTAAKMQRRAERQR